MKKLVLPTIAIVLVSGPARAQTITDPAAFGAAVAAVQKDSHSVDKFAEPLALPIDGKPFKITIPATDSYESSGGVIYDYKDGVLMLDVTPTNVWPSQVGPKEALPALLVSNSTKTTGSYIGQNAYGATARVTGFNNKGAAVAIVSGPKPMLSPSRARMKADILEDTDWWTQVTLAPAEAKALANDTVGVIEGHYTKLPSGKAGACHFGGSSATIDHPSTYTSEVCYIGANITRIALVRKSNGEVIKEWTAMGNPTLGPVLWGSVRVGMNERELQAAYPDVTDYHYLPSGEAQVTFSKQVASSVEVRSWPVRGKKLAKLLTSKYGEPIEFKCVIDEVCEGRWRAGDGVSAYLNTMNFVTFQPADAKPPIGYMPGRN